MYTIILFFLTGIVFSCKTEISENNVDDSRDSEAIRAVMDMQEKAWNSADIHQFMEGYWKNDSLMFIGTNGITYGFDNTLKRYLTNYDSRDKMGILKFEILELKKVVHGTYLMVGSWHLTRNVGDIGGIFTLTWKEIDGKWVIIADHTS